MSGILMGRGGGVKHLSLLYSILLTRNCLSSDDSWKAPYNEPLNQEGAVP